MKAVLNALRAFADFRLTTTQQQAGDDLVMLATSRGSLTTGDFRAAAGALARWDAVAATGPIKPGRYRWNGRVIEVVFCVQDQDGNDVVLAYDEGEDAMSVFFSWSRWTRL